MKYKDISEEINYFSQISNWWDELGDMRPLHAMMPARLSFILNALEKEKKTTQGRQPLKGVSVLDVGAGGGLMAEPMARLGARVSAYDASRETVEAAQRHAHLMNLDIDYRFGYFDKKSDESIEEGLDVVLALEVIEHVDNPQQFVKNCLARLKKDGVLILSTLNRTTLSYVAGIILAEQVLKWVKPGAHQWQKFLHPSEVRQFLHEGGADVFDMAGIVFDPLKNSWNLSKNLKINYILAAKFSEKR